MNTTKPRYQQLKDLIIGRIAAGELRPSDRVPSEHELVAAMKVSRMTANRALRELHDEGYVERIAGRGTFVSDQRAQSALLEVRNIADEIAGRGHRHASSVVRQSRQHARGEIAKALQVEQGTDVFHLLLVHYEDDEPIQVEDRHVLASFAPDCLGQDFAAVTPSAYLTSIAPLQEADHVVRAAMPNAAVRQRLHMADDEPALVVIRRTWSEGRPVTFTRLHHPGSRYELTGRLEKKAS
ncbi:MAG: histidine utilization repressor [Gammaproteobacteria bacterium]|nr:histidine utilization repressor [Gammaproteobacteria bacterium]NNF48832.1 histidine utilization repressor [Woeseiaceae bacterium]MBT8093806.1 histidine utilization repressor [Gammaproteobacteria bacterium]MBT8105890.1 histidine utilization repressor [Gammaproteobacteria bacterium]NNK25904.1 histidine utilization repressor [Woeseiaceae bacterium]